VFADLAAAQAAINAYAVESNTCRPHQSPGVEQFDQLYAAGSQLGQQEAVAAVHAQRGAGTAAP
jgi:hypothetical protein